MGILDRLNKIAEVEESEVAKDLLISNIKIYDNKPQLLRGPYGPESYIHASSLESFCARR